MAPRIETVTDAAGLATLKEEWNALAAGFPTPLLRFEWFDACFKANRDRADLFVIVVREREAARAIVPLLIDRTGTIPRLRPLDYFTYEVNGFPFADDEALALACAETLRLRLPLLFQRLRVDAPEARAFRAARASGWRMFRSAGDLVGCPLAGGWQTLEAGMSSSSRKFIRRKRKIAERNGPVSFEVVSPDMGNVDQVLDDVFHVEAAGWKGAAGTALLMDARIREFCVELAHDFARLGLLRVFFLRIGGAIAATRLTIEYGGRLWEIKIGYDERWAQASPGILLMHETLRYACEHGLDAYEYLGASEAWHRHWPLQVRPCVSFRFYPHSARGALLFAEDALVHALSRASARWRTTR